MPHSPLDRMNPTEVRAAAGLSLVFAFRMLGMFMVLPVLATYGLALEGATPSLIGLAIGAYGLTQAVLQIPFGILSDRVGRLPIIYGGLLIFALGAVVAAESSSIWGVIGGRVLQGAGAISAAVMALLSDVTREQHRTRAMAAIGLSIGLSFAVAMVVGPVITQHFGLSGLFWVTAIMAVVGGLIVSQMPKAQTPCHHRETLITQEIFLRTLKNPELGRLNLGILVLHAVLMASFVALPLVLIEQGHWPKEQHWQVYLGSLVIGFVSMIPWIIYGEKRRQMKRVLLGAIALLLSSEVLLGVIGHRLSAIVFCMLLFFTAFNLLEASLPSLVSKVAPAGSKGTAMGIYATSQFLGAALGGILGGWLYQHGGATAVFACCSGACVFWLYTARAMREPPYVTSVRLTLSQEQLAQPNWQTRLQALPGVTEVAFVPEEAAAYVKFDRQKTDYAHLEAALTPE